MDLRLAGFCGWDRIHYAFVVCGAIQVNVTLAVFVLECCAELHKPHLEHFCRKVAMVIVHLTRLSLQLKLPKHEKVVHGASNQTIAMALNDSRCYNAKSVNMLEASKHMYQSASASVYLFPRPLLMYLLLSKSTQEREAMWLRLQYDSFKKTSGLNGLLLWS